MAFLLDRCGHHVVDDVGADREQQRERNADQCGHNGGLGEADEGTDQERTDRDGLTQISGGPVKDHLVETLEFRTGHTRVRGGDEGKEEAERENRAKF